jgi:transposase
MSETATLDPTEGRRQRGLKIAACCRITEKNGFWHVPSQTGHGSYSVCLDPAPFVPQCTCDDYEKRNQPCKHIYAVRYVIERENNPNGSETTTETVAVAQRVVAKKKTYKQVWPAYNAAQTTEKDRFQEILHDLCQGLVEPAALMEKGGRPPVSLADRIFAATFKVFSGIAGRRFTCDLRDALKRGHLTRAPHYNSIFRYLEDPTLTPILHRLIKESSLPLRAVECDFSIDSSGFATSRFVRWFDHKYGCPREKYDWVKVSVCTGIKTNVVTAVVVDEKKGGDCPQFAPLVNATAARFVINEVSADAAFASYANAELVAQHGGTPFIAFPSNTTAAKGGIFAKMFHYYSFNRDDFLAHYHKRSNVESTFSMVKAKFGDSLRSKTDTAMVNEALCKILCHNICCLIQSHYELGIEATFWAEEKSEEAVSAPEPIFDTMEAMAWI